MNWRRDEVIFETHGPGPWCAPGMKWQSLHGGTVYRITRMREVGPTALLTGGSAPCWEVRGRPV